MKKDDTPRPVVVDARRMWALSEDRKTVRQRLPPLRIRGREAPLHLHRDLDSKQVDELFEWLCKLRAQMVQPGEAVAVEGPPAVAETRSPEDEPG